MLTHVALSIAILAQSPLDDERAPAKSERAGCFDDEDLEVRRNKLKLGLALGGTAAFLASLTTLLVAKRPTMTPDGPVCTTGKPCGNTCIAEQYECHVGQNWGDGRVTRTGWIVGGTFFAVGLGLLIATFVAPPRLKPKRVKCDLSGCGLTVHF